MPDRARRAPASPTPSLAWRAKAGRSELEQLRDKAIVALATSARPQLTAEEICSARTTDFRPLEGRGVLTVIRSGRRVRIRVPRRARDAIQAYSLERSDTEPWLFARAGGSLRPERVDALLRLTRSA